MTNGDHPNYIIEIGQNTEKSPGDLRRLAVTKTPVKDHQLTLVWKTLIIIIIINICRMFHLFFFFHLVLGGDLSFQQASIQFSLHMSPSDKSTYSLTVRKLDVQTLVFGLVKDLKMFFFASVSLFRIHLVLSDFFFLFILPFWIFLFVYFFLPRVLERTFCLCRI